MNESQITLLDRKQLLCGLPFGEEALFLDRVEVPYYNGGYPLGTAYVVVTEDHCRGHFPNHPILPAHLEIEMAFQAAGACLLEDARRLGIDTRGKLVMAVSLEDASFKSTACPGEELAINVMLDHHATPRSTFVVKFKAEGKVGDRIVFQTVQKLLATSSKQ